MMYRAIFSLFVFFIARSAEASLLYLPTQLSPEIEAHIERLFVVANMPIIKRPIPVSRVYKALDDVGDEVPQLAAKVRQYLKRYEHRVNITHASVAPILDRSSNKYLPANQRGFDNHAEIVASIASHGVISDWFVVNVGGVYGQTEWDRDDYYDGSFVSLGGTKFQIDIGYRPHWFGPFQDSDMLISTNAGSMPSVTFSNGEPLIFLGMDVGYELFLAQMSESEQIRAVEDRTQLSIGNPRLFGVHLSVEPFAGFAIGFNRLMQYGGGDRDSSVSAMLEAFIRPKDADNITSETGDFGNQLSSVTTRYTFAGDFPLSVYMEYAGEDTSAPSYFHLGNSALMFGVHMPIVFENFDMTYETAEWQNGWYVNGNYGDGLNQYGSIVGHWGGQRRTFGDAIGAQAKMVKVNWFGSNRMVTFAYRSIENTPLSSTEYQKGKEYQLRLSQPWKAYWLGLTIEKGSDVFGEDYGQVSAFARW